MQGYQEVYTSASTHKLSKPGRLRCVGCDSLRDSGLGILDNLRVVFVSESLRKTSKCASFIVGFIASFNTVVVIIKR